jgi:SAM-dependent methyltransferase
MARTWQEAQQNELQFWRRIYVERQPDIQTYLPVTPEDALAFTAKTIGRFGEALEDLDGLTVADVGCGPYGLLKGLQVFEHRTGLAPALTYGVDPLIKEYGRFRLIDPSANIRLLEGVGERLPLASQSCDRVFSINALDHTESPEQVLRECWRITRPGGSLNVSVHVVRGPFAPLRRCLKYVDTNHPYHFSRADVRRMLASVCGAVALEAVVHTLVDQPEYAFRYFWRAPQKGRALRRWAATFMLETYYARCVKCRS